MPIRSIILSVFAITVGIAVSTASRADDAKSDVDVETPRTLDDRLRIELVAAEPQIVTPIGITVDPSGRLLIVESQTHQRQADYDGPPTDRIRAVEDTDGDGKLDRWSTFHEGFQLALNVEAGRDGSVYVTNGTAVVRLRDTDDDGRADEQSEIVTFECAEMMAHSGLVGLGVSGDGTLYLGLGKNTGKPYRIAGSDGAAFQGGGEGGSIFHCQPDGSGLERMATGLWNPFGICVDPYGRVFCTENDPDSSPPCRLLHIVAGGDYGYQRRFGRSGLHPLQSWNGEIAGTLGMVCSLGEAPSEIANYRGALWVASWGDHTIDRYQIRPRGASFEATREIMVQGNSNFRPVGLAAAPDGSLYVSDWVDLRYPVHGKGRIWRLSWRDDNAAERLSFPPPSDTERQAEEERKSPDLANLSSPDPFLRQAAAWGYAQDDHLSRIDWNALADSTARLGYLQALRWKGELPSDTTLDAALRDPDLAVRAFTIRWIAELRLRHYRKAFAQMLESDETDAQQYLVLLAATDWLDRGSVSTSGTIADDLLVRELASGDRPPHLQTLALRMLSPDNDFLTTRRIERYLESPFPALQMEAVRTLTEQTGPERLDILLRIAINDNDADTLRAEAVMGLASVAADHVSLLESLATSESPMVRREAQRTLRLAGLRPPPDEPKPPAQDIDAWLRLVGKGGDAESGRRLFFSAVGPRCAVCHHAHGRGGQIGPDLSLIAGANSPRRILTSILIPSQEMNDRYIPWLMQTDDGKLHVGIPFQTAGIAETQAYFDENGEKFSLLSDAIEVQTPSPTSIMPTGMEKLMSIEDFRDLFAFLMRLKPHGE